MPAIVHGTGRFTIDPGKTMTITATWPRIPGSSGPNHGPVFAMADPDNQPAGAILITFDYSKCRHAGGAGTGEVFYQYKVRSESTAPVTFKMEYYDPR